MILGLEFRAVPVSIKDDYGLRGDALQKVMKADQEAGYIPFFVGEFLYHPISGGQAYNYSGYCRDYIQRSY